MIALNGFKICLSGNTFHARVRDEPNGEKVHEYRKKHGKQWFFYWEAGKLYTLHKSAPPEEIGRMNYSHELITQDYLTMLAARLVNALPDAMPQYRPHQYRPFSWLRDTDMMKQCLRGISGLPKIINDFTIRPRYVLDAKVIEMVEGERHLGLIFNRYMRWDINALPSDLEKVGVSTSGLFVVKRIRERGKRRLVGRIQSLYGHKIRLADAYDDLKEVNEDEIWLEGSSASFSQCMKSLLGNQYERYLENLERVISLYQASDKVEEEINAIEQELITACPIYLGGGLYADLEGRLQPTNTPTYKSVVQSSPVEYCFDAGGTKRAFIAWGGLTRYGPFSRDTFPKKSPTIR